MIKKFILILAITIAMMYMVGCGNSNNQDTSTTNDTTSQTLDNTIEETSIETMEDTSSQEEITSETSIQNEESSSTNTDLNAMVDEITSKIEWASLMPIEDEALIKEFFTLDANNPNYKQLLVMQCPMSAVIAEIILIEADDVNSAMDDLAIRRDKLINSDAYYPEHKEIAEKSIIGSNGNIVYFIASQSAEDSEKILLDYLSQLS